MHIIGLILIIISIIQMRYWNRVAKRLLKEGKIKLYEHATYNKKGMWAIAFLIGLVLLFGGNGHF